MADQEQVERLRRGVSEWNRWRDEHPEIKIDLRRTNLGGVNLERASLSGADLREANLEGAILLEADLSGANLNHANLSNTSLLEASLSGANLSHADLSGASLMETILAGASLEHTTFAGATLERTDLRGIPWLLIMELTLQPDIVWKDVLHDFPDKLTDSRQP